MAAIRCHRARRGGKPRNLQFRELDSAQLPRSLPDVDAAVINTNFALEAGLNPTRDALAIEPPDSPYANVLAVQAARSSDPRIQALAAALTSPGVAQFIRDRYQGAVVPSGGRHGGVDAKVWDVKGAARDISPCRSSRSSADQSRTGGRRSAR